MNNLIDRQAAIDALNREYRCGAVINHRELETAIDRQKLWRKLMYELGVQGRF